MDSDSEIDSETLNVMVDVVEIVPADGDAERVVVRDSVVERVIEKVAVMEVEILTEILSSGVWEAVMGSDSDVVKVRLVDTLCDVEDDNVKVFPLLEEVMGMETVSVMGRDCVSVTGRD